MYRVTLPYSTRTTGVDIFDTDNTFRQRDIDLQVHLLNRDDGTFHKLLDLYSLGEPTTQMVYYYTEDDILGIHTQVNYSSGYAATVTSIVVDDSKLFIVNSEIHVTRTLENMLVTAVNNTTSTLTVIRGYNNTPAAALVDDDVLVAGIVHLPEEADANGGNGRVPTTEKYNFVSRFSQSFKVTNVQEKSAMYETGIGQITSVEKEVSDVMFECKRKVNKAMIFQHRGTYSTSDGTIYCSQGFIHGIEDNMLNLANYNDSLSWPVLSDFIDQLCDPTASSTEKIIDAGPYLFGAVLRMRRDMSTPPSEYYHPDLNVDAVSIRTENGNTATFLQDKRGFPPAEGLAGWGVCVDLAHVQKREFNGEPMAWRPNIQAASQHIRWDEYFGSFSLQMMHQDCHGFIRGAAKSIID